MRAVFDRTRETVLRMAAWVLSNRFRRTLIACSGAAFIGVTIATVLALAVVSSPQTASARTTIEKACRTTVTLTKVSYGGADIGKEWVFKASAGGGSANTAKHDLKRGRFEYRDDLVLHRVDSQAPSALRIAATASEVDSGGNDVGSAFRDIDAPACGGAKTLELPVRVSEGGNVAVMTFAFRIETLIQPSSGEPEDSPIDGALHSCPDFLLDLALFRIDIPDPGWVWVDPNQKFRSASGLVTQSDVSHTDFPYVHDSHDQNTHILVDRGQEDILSDVAQDNPADRRAPDTLEMEWEIGTLPPEKTRDPEHTFPKWAWPNEGDRVWVDGHWIFDCGHRAAETGEARTEIHPARAIASMRDQVRTLPGTGATPVPVTTTDLYIHGRAGFVTDVLECRPGIILGKGTCGVSPYPHRGTSINENFEFDIHLPPKPAPNAVLATVIQGGPRNTVDIAPRLEPTPSGDPAFVHVTVPLAGSSVTPNDVYARKIYAGWVYPPGQPLRHFRLTLNKMDLHSDKDVDPGDCECTFFWMNVDRTANEWIRLSSFARGNMNDYDDDRGLGNGEMRFSGATSDFYVRNGQPFTVRANGYDQDCLDNLFGEPHRLSRGELADCYAGRGPFKGEPGDNDEHANFLANFGPPGSYGVGAQDVTAKGEYELEFTISEIPVSVEDRADLRLSKTCTPEVALAGERVTCAILVDNLGPGLPRNVVVSDQLLTDVDPSDYALSTPTFTIEGGGGDGRPCNITPPDRFTCELGTVPVGGRAHISAAFTSTAEGSFDNQASVSTSSTDPNSANNRASDRVTVGPPSQFLVPFEASGWRFSEVASGEEVPGFESSLEEPPGFETGQAAFGSGGDCPLQSTVHTDWSINTDLLLRRTIELPANPTWDSLVVEILIDNDFVAYWNGREIGRGQTDGCPGSFRLEVPGDVQQRGDTNLLAIRAHDRGGESFVDASVIGVIE